MLEGLPRRGQKMPEPAAGGTGQRRPGWAGSSWEIHILLVLLPVKRTKLESSTSRKTNKFKSVGKEQEATGSHGFTESGQLWLVIGCNGLLKLAHYSVKPKTTF